MNIEKLSVFIYDLFSSYIEHCDDGHRYIDVCSLYYINEEIIKEVERIQSEKNEEEFCKWVDNGYTYTSECDYVFEDYWTYCPHCGKKIKVIK